MSTEENKKETTAYKITSVGRQRFGTTKSLKSHPKDNPIPYSSPLAAVTCALPPFV